MSADESRAAAIELRGVSKKYGKAIAVDDVTLSIPRGAVLGLIGPNGAGKSTIIRMIMGMLRPSAGRVRVLGRDVASHAPAIRRRVGYVPERHDIYPWMTVNEVICFARPFYEKWDNDYCDEMLDLFALSRLKKVKQLSKGMLVKLGLILAVAHRPELLVLDEPTTGLDPIVHEDFLNGVMRSICDERCTVLFSSHDLGDVRRLADSLCILRDGRILVQRQIDELLASAKRVRVVLSDGSLPRWTPERTLWQHLDRREWLLTVDDCDDRTTERIKAENRVESVEVFELSLNELFRDYIVGQGGGEHAR